MVRASASRLLLKPGRFVGLEYQQSVNVLGTIALHDLISGKKTNEKEIGKLLAGARKQLPSVVAYVNLLSWMSTSSHKICRVRSQACALRYPLINTPDGIGRSSSNVRLMFLGAHSLTSVVI